MFPCQRSKRIIIQCWFRPYCKIQSHSFTTLSKEQREQRLADKYKPNTVLPKKIGQLANITSDQLIYFPKMDKQLNEDFYKLNDNKDKDDLSLNMKGCIYEYNGKKIRGNTKELKESLQFGLFTIISLGAPAVLFGTMYNYPEWSNKMIGYMSFDWFFYWTQAGFMAFLVAAFFVGLRHQIGSWFKMLKNKIYGSHKYVSNISILPRMNLMNIQYCHNTIFNKKILSHNIELNTINLKENQLIYLEPAINSITESPDVRYYKIFIFLFFFFYGYL